MQKVPDSTCNSQSEISSTASICPCFLSDALTVALAGSLDLLTKATRKARTALWVAYQITLECKPKSDDVTLTSSVLTGESSLSARSDLLDAGTKG